MSNSFRSAWLIAPVLASLAGCASAPAPETEAHSAESVSAEPAVQVDGAPAVGAAAAAVEATKETISGKSRRGVRAQKAASRVVTVECSVKLPDDPTDNPGLCRSFQIVFVDQEGNESPRYRFGGDARYLFSGRLGRKYRIKPIVGKNWEVSIDPDREVVIGEKVRVQLRQKE